MAVMGICTAFLYFANHYWKFQAKKARRLTPKLVNFVRAVCLWISKHGTLIARFMGPTWGPSGADRTQVGPMLAPWTLLCRYLYRLSEIGCFFNEKYHWLYIQLKFPTKHQLHYFGLKRKGITSVYVAFVLVQTLCTNVRRRYLYNLNGLFPYLASATPSNMIVFSTVDFIFTWCLRLHMVSVLKLFCMNCSIFRTIWCRIYTKASKGLQLFTPELCCK